MRILLAHSYYRSSAPSGENQVFEAERDLLLRKGHEVAVLTRHSDELAAVGVLGTIAGALRTPWNPAAAWAMRRAVRAFRPDVVHVHNVFPMLSPAVLHAVEPPVALVATLHNYRVLCPAAIPMRKARPCVDCITAQSVGPALVHGCYRDSRLATLPLAMSVGLQRALGTFSRRVHAIVALSEFQRSLLVGGGLPPSRIVVKPNFLGGDLEPPSWAGREEAVVFVGRLSPEKGVGDLLEAWRLWGEGAPELRIVGDGSARAALEAAGKAIPGGKVRFLGILPPEAAREEIRKARLLVMPSTWYETFGMVVLQAMQSATPVAVASVGSLPELAGSEGGISFPPSAPRELAATVKDAWQDLSRLESLGQGARRRYEREFSESTAHERLMTVYEGALARSRSRADS